MVSALRDEAAVSEAALHEALFCIPQEVTNGQAVRVVVAYIDKHPEHLHESFNLLAILALGEAWPCKK
jgi:hypothetical protein